MTKRLKGGSFLTGHGYRWVWIQLWNPWPFRIRKSVKGRFFQGIRQWRTHYYVKFCSRPPFSISSSASPSGRKSTRIWQEEHINRGYAVSIIRLFLFTFYSDQLAKAISHAASQLCCFSLKISCSLQRSRDRILETAWTPAARFFLTKNPIWQRVAKHRFLLTLLGLVRSVF